MPYETTLIYSEPLLRRTVFAFWRRSIGLGFVVTLAAIALILGWVVVQGVATGLIGVFVTALVLGVTFPMILCFVHYRNLLHNLHAMDKPQATFRAEETSFTISSSIGTTTHQWSEVKELWQFPGVWLLLYSKAQFSILPLACMSPEMQAFVAQQVRATGGKVSGRGHQ